MNYRGILLPLACLFAATLAGCGGAGSATQVAQQTYTVSVQANNQPVSAGQLVLYSSQFIAPNSDSAILTVSIAPAPTVAPVIAWSTNNRAVSLSQTVSTCTGCPPVPAGGIFATMSATGLTTITATIGAPVNSTASIVVPTYSSLVVGCGLRYTPSYDFDAGNSVSDLTSDLYATDAPAPGDPFDRCARTAFATGTPALHYPYGGVFVSGNIASFPSISSSQWQNAGTSSAAPANGILLFKTRGGAIVKALVPLGPYEVTDASGKFPY